MEMVHLASTGMTWQRFEVCNPDTKTAFENLCRAVFNQDFFGGTAHFHSNPNNPGVEIEPIYHKETGKRISFQSKYFTSTDTLNLRWVTEQDASQVDTVSLVVPCMSLVRTLGLLQKEYNGCFYDSAGNLIAFDARPLGLGSSSWFRKKEMLRYIRETGYVLFWTCFGEKQFFTGGWGRQITGDWSGFYYLDKDGNITGNNQFFE